MNKLSLWLSFLLLSAWAAPAEAQGIFGLFGSKRPKGNAVQRVPELIVLLKTSQDERARSNAVSELGLYDGAMFPEITPVLIEVLQTDPRSGVRYEAVSSLGALRPITQSAGLALERAAANDESWRVRMHAKSVAMKYRLAGFSPGMAPGRNVKTEEPPLLEIGPVIESTPTPGQFPAGVIKREEGVPQFRPAKPLPQGPTFSTVVPQQPKTAAPPPLPMVEEGPALTPPTTPMTPPAPKIEPPPVRSPF